MNAPSLAGALHDPATEKAVLSLIVTDPGCRERAAVRIVPAMFFDEANRIWAEQLFWLHDHGRPFDVESIPARLREVGRWEEAGKETRWAEILGCLAFSNQIDAYLDRLIELHGRRILYGAASHAQEQLLDPGIVTQRIEDEFRQALDGIARRAEGEKIATLFQEATFTLDGIEGLNLPKRKPLVGSWFYESALGFLYGPRGIGKTWLSAKLAACLASGQSFGPWMVPEPCRVLYLDGEMPLDAFHARFSALLEGPRDHLFTLHHEALWHLGEKPLCLSDPEQQRVTIELAVSLGIRVIFADNLSTLLRGVRENEADDWSESFQPFLLELRRRRIAVVLIHHAGRNGLMRGTSKREDMADFILQLSASDDHRVTDEAGARFVATFTKNRHAVEPCPALDWRFAMENGKLAVTHRECSLADRLLGLVGDGLTSCGDLAAELGASKGAISKLATRLQREGKLKIEGREYRLP